MQTAAGCSVTHDHCHRHTRGAPNQQSGGWTIDSGVAEATVTKGT